MPAVTEHIGPKTLDALLAKKSREFYSFAKAAEDVAATVMDLPIDNLSVDESRMVVGPVVISTANRDRVGDVLVPSGIVLDSYAKNPVVLWDHGFSNEDGGSMPIAMSESPDKQLVVFPSEEDVQAWAYFHGKTALSSQVFGLLAVKAIRAASVRPIPKDSDMIVDPETDAIGILMKTWEMPEWSFVAIGCNHEALTKAIRDKRINGELLARPLLKSFGHLDLKPARGTGMPDIVKTIAEDDEAKPDETATETPSDEAGKKAGGDEVVSQETNMKPGAQYLSALHAGIKELINAGEPGLRNQEKDEVSEAATAVFNGLKDMMAAVESTYAGLYSDHPALTNESEAEEEDAETEDKLKSFLAQGVLARARYKGFKARLQPLLTCKGLTPREKLVLQETLNGMERIERDAENFVDSRLLKKIEQVEAMQQRTHKHLLNNTPHERIAAR